VRKLERWDALLLVTLLPAWLVCFSLHVREVRRSGLALPPVFAVPSDLGDGYPRVGGLRSETFLAETGLTPGNRMLRVGEVDLRGVGYIGFAAHALAEAGPDLSVPIAFESGGETRRVELRLSTPPVPWFRIPVLLTYAVTALLVLVRGAQAAQARRFFAAFMSLFLIEMPFDGPAYAQTVASQALFHLVGGTAVALMLRWAILFPEEMAAAHRISPRWAWMAALLWYAGRLNYLTGFPLAPEMLPAVTLVIDWLIAIAFLAALSWNYAHATPIGQRRIRWLTYGIYLGSLCYGLTSTLGLLDPSSPWLDELYLLSALALILLPLGTLVALLRYNLFDVDRLISATLSYNLVGVAVVALALGMVPRVAHAVSTSIGIDPNAGQLALSLLLAAIVVPAHRRLRPQVDRLLFADAHRLEEGVEDLIAEMSSGGDSRSLVQLAAERLQDLLRPESSSLYLRSEGGFAPVFVHGREAPPSFEPDHPLIAALRSQRASLALERGGARRGAAGMGAFERAALEVLGVPVVVPLRQGAALRGFICLGRKRSGDIYTATDLAFLTAVADKLASELAREPEARDETPVTILFSDLVDSTRMLERVGDERAQRIFARHHERLGVAIASVGGRELQWLGDGVMAAFDSTADAVRCAVTMQRDSEDEMDGERLRVRVGLNVGEVLRQETGSGYFGLALVTARRLCDRAQAGQILCSQTVAGLLAGRAGFRFREVGRFELKGGDASVSVCEVLY
jgi:class 3 adenylate cyclase